jgi:hypothetical protein
MCVAGVAEFDDDAIADMPAIDGGRIQAMPLSSCFNGRVERTSPEEWRVYQGRADSQILQLVA